MRRRNISVFLKSENAASPYERDTEEGSVKGQEGSLYNLGIPFAATSMSD